MPVTLDPEVLKVAEYVYENLLSQPYTEVGPEWEFNYKNPTATNALGDGHNLQRSIQVEGKTLHRPIHGLAHTMRTLMYSQLMYESTQRQSGPHICRDGRSIADLTPLDLKKLNIAQLFFVAGRASEASYGDAYHRYHLYGAKHFESYARQHLTHLFSEKEIELYARCIEDREGDYFDSTAEGYLIHLSHMIDLMRCKSPVEVFIGHSQGSRGIVPTLIDLFGHDDGLDILHFARGLFAATGEGVPYIDSTEWPHLGIEKGRVERAQMLVGFLQVDGQEADAKKTAQAGFSVEGCYEALKTVDTPSWYHQKAIKDDKAQEPVDVKEMKDEVVINFPQQQQTRVEKEQEITITREESSKDNDGCLARFLKQLFWSAPNPKTDIEKQVVSEYTNTL
ncbi:SdeA protein [Legionella oakridgensis]|nr:SidE phosphodiesterase domain-containing protein [Legionella longbeachae]EEZ97076.1 SdeD-LaiF [Legionella longbeachae D-4968]UAK46932.1 SidE phosphodiesterase domain-containing protein [Legionella longbeachae]VEE03971.1 SdeA protein [Legionella oakridgensis]HBD7397247.1 NAD-dependent ubiquitin ligase [Legionella pneumophila]